ncbi:hypothetical protein JL722_11489 [Aureococcus anophagefferens]|nr:hypothetical protein JL722_11489 [Aureococcus anophagefferens]
MVPRGSSSRRACAARAALVLLWMLPRHAGSFISPAPARRRSTTHRAARDAPNGGAAPDAGSFIAPARRRCTSRRAAQDGPSDNAAPSRRAMLRRAALAGAASVVAASARRAAGRDDWWGAEGILDWVANDKQQTAVASRVSSAYYSQEFVTYLSRFLLNFDGSCAAWWAAQAATVPPSYGERRRFEALAAAFESFSSSVEYGLRRYPGETTRLRRGERRLRDPGLAPFVAGRAGRATPSKRGERGVGRERRLDPATYAGFALSGLVGCSATHAVLVPIDVVKTRLQTDPGRYAGVVDGGRAILREEGPGALFLGAEATLAGYCWYGLTVYPGYEFWSRTLNGLLAPAAAAEFHAAVVLLAGALATVLACVGVCPAEALRIRVVADPARFAGLGLAGSARRVADDEGADAFYAGFRPLVIRQVIFGMPADAVLSRINADRGDLGVAGAVEAIWGEGHVRGFYRGAGARCAWSGLVISGQFAIYDALKSLLSVAGPDLTLFLDVAL